MANDLSARMRLARLMGSGGGDSDGIRPVRRTSGTAVSDSADGKVRVQLSDGDPIEVPTSVAVKSGQTVSLLVSGGVATCVGVSGWGDEVEATANGAKDTADAAKTSAASAVSTANAASSTAGDAKSTADSLATLIRADSTGITVGKSADGQTWSTGRTRMTDSAFQVLDKVGVTIAQLAEDGVSFLAGLVRIVAGKATLPGNLKVNSITIDAGDGVAAMHGIISRLEATINGVTSSVSAGWEQDFGYGVTAIVGESTTAHLASDKAELRVGDNHMTMTQDGLTVDRLGFSKSPTWTVGRSVEDKCRAAYCIQGGTVFLSVNTSGDWWSIDGWVNVGPSLFSDVTHDQTTGVPPSLRPAERIYFPASTYSGDLLKGYVGTDGSIWLHHSGSVANWSFSVSWPVGGA